MVSFAVSLQSNTLYFFPFASFAYGLATLGRQGNGKQQGRQAVLLSNRETF